MDLTTLQFSLDGSPWAKISTNSSLILETLQYSLDGSPWYGQSPTTDVSNSNFLFWFFN